MKKKCHVELADYSYPHSYPLKPVPSTREEHDEQQAKQLKPELPARQKPMAGWKTF